MLPSPMLESCMVVCGPTVLPEPIRVSPWRLVNGAITESWPISTPASMIVASGRTIVTPARMWRSWIRRWAIWVTLASATRSLIPSVSVGS